MVQPPFKVYETKAEWDTQARIFMSVGFSFGLLIGALIITITWLLSSI